MSIFRFSNAGGFGTYQRYNDFLAGNPAVNLDKGSMYPLGVFTLASSQATVEFTNIPQTYTHLQLRTNFLCSATNNPHIRVGGSSIDTGSNYSWHHLYGDGSSALNNGSGGQSFVYCGYSQNSSNPNVSVIDILDYRNVNKNKTMRILAGQDNNGGGEVALWSGSWYNSSTAIQSIRFSAPSGNFNANSSFALYGVQA